MSNVSNEMMLDGDAGGSDLSTQTPEALDPAAVYEARGYYGDESYINELVGNTGVGSGTLKQRQDALAILIQQGKDRAAGGDDDGGDDDGGDDDGGDDDGGGDEFSPAVNAKEILRQALASYGLESLYEFAYSLYAKQEIDIDESNSFIFALREQEAYKKRFAGNERRKSLGFKELLPATYIALEKQYKETLAANGLPQGFYDSSEDFERLIGGDVSVTELNNRLKDAYSVVRDASPSVKAKMAELYGVTDGDLLAYVIDPERARDLMSPDYKRQAQAALIAENAQRLSKINLGAADAEQFVRQGITTTEAETAFANIGQMGELRRGGFGEEQISDIDFAKAALGTDAEAKRKVEERKKRRIGDVSASGGSATLTQGESGSLKSGYGQSNL